MCGIAGGINCRIDGRIVGESLRHRGPDDRGEYGWRNCRLLHTRLAIQDLEGGAQPMEHDGLVIVFNGEIYNHLELRRELGESQFRTRSDTETLLRLYREYGTGMFDRIDGMFALAILDRERGRLLLAVDRAGKKPLYLYRKGDTLFFASELRTVARACAPTIDESAIAAYLRSGFFPRSSTPYREVSRLENGHWLSVELETLESRKERFFSMEELYRRADSITEDDEALESVEEALRRSVRRRLLSSDREVGAFLSGGIDSSLVVAMAAEHTDGLKTFTVAFEGSYDESELAKLTARRYGTDHHTLHISMDLRDDVEGILSAYGMPFADSSAIPSWYVSKAAKEHVTVVLNGDGADELFAGYRRYVPVANDWLIPARLLAPVGRLLPRPREKQSLYTYLYRLLEMSGKRGLDFYLSATTDIFEGVYDLGRNPVLERLAAFIEACDLKGLERMLCLDFELLLFSDLLVKMDIATMAHSLEARSPFLGAELLELAPRLLDRHKIRGTQTKWVLRRLAERYLDPTLVTQPKRGFEVPLRRWVDGELKEAIADRLAPGCYAQGYFERSFIDDLLHKRLAVAPEKRAKMLWSLFALEVWRHSL